MTVEIYRRPGPTDDVEPGGEWILSAVFENGEWTRGGDQYDHLDGDDLDEEFLHDYFDGPRVVAVRPDETRLGVTGSAAE